MLRRGIRFLNSKESKYRKLVSRRRYSSFPSHRTLLTGLVLIAATGWAILSLRQETVDEPLLVYCAVSVRPAIEAILAEIDERDRPAVVLQFGASGGLETQARLSGQGDLFIPAATEPFLIRAKQDGLVTSILPLAEMQLVLASEPEAPSIASLAELLASGKPFAIANVEAAAGHYAEQAFSAAMLNDRLRDSRRVQLPTVTEVAEAVRSSGQVRYGIVWEATARQWGLTYVVPPELVDARAAIGIGVLAGSRRSEAAQRLAEQLTSPAISERVLKQLHYSER